MMKGNTQGKLLYLTSNDAIQQGKQSKCEDYYYYIIGPKFVLSICKILNLTYNDAIQQGKQSKCEDYYYSSGPKFGFINM